MYSLVLAVEESCQFISLSVSLNIMFAVVQTSCHLITNSLRDDMRC